MEGSVDVVEVLKVFWRYRFETLSRPPTVFIEPIDHVFHGLTFIHEAANSFRLKETARDVNDLIGAQHGCYVKRNIPELSSDLLIF